MPIQKYKPEQVVTMLRQGGSVVGKWEDGPAGMSGGRAPGSC